jgi:tRNA1Val (adenine37-N6)-methyltransferase
VNKNQMIKNDIYTYDYFQPEDYRFSLDSIFLAQKVAKLIERQTDLEDWKILDLCAGCGIIGLELSLHQPKIKSIDFLEIQNLYRDYFNQNVRMIKQVDQHEQFRFLNINYSALLDSQWENSFDLILSNPPYFFKGEGLLSPNEFKNRCRFFLDSDFQTLIEACLHSLKPGRCAYLLIRKGNAHGRNPEEEIKQLLADRAHGEVIDSIRGTDVFEIRKKHE